MSLRPSYSTRRWWPPTNLAGRYPVSRRGGSLPACLAERHEARLAPVIERLKGVTTRATRKLASVEDRHWRTLTIVPWPHARVARLEGYAEARNTARRRRESGETPPGGPFEERLPDEFRAALAPQMPDAERSQPLSLFSEDNAIYRVMRSPMCMSIDWPQVVLQSRRRQDRNHRHALARTRPIPSLHPHPGQQDIRGPSRLDDYDIYLGGGADVCGLRMFLDAGALPPAGLTVSQGEFERHKASAYRAILTRRENGIDLIENGVVRARASARWNRGGQRPRGQIAIERKQALPSTI